MHPALFVFEVLLEIFSHLYQISGPLGGESLSVRIAHAVLVTQKSLAALARTCKTFYEPAMDLLWAELNGITPLLGCVPSLYPIISGAQGFYHQGIEPLSEHEARRFLRHAARVRVLRIHTDAHFPLLVAVLQAVETCLFPGLRSLSWTVRDANTRHVQFLRSPALCRLSVSTIYSNIKSIVARCPALEDLFINQSFRNTADELSLVSDTVCSCKRLVNLSCAPLDWAAWKHLSNIPTLLTVAIQGQFLSPLNWDSLDFAHFLNLTALSFSVKTAADITTVIRYSEFPSLQRFTMHVSVLAWAEAEQLFSALSQCKACSTLRHIEINSTTVLKDDEQLGMSLTAIRRFLCFTQLQTLRLRVHHSIYLDNDLLVEAMSSWPHIRSLELMGHPHLCQPTVTFRALFTALHFCPHLHTLQVAIDAVNIDIDPIAEPLQHTSLQTLRVGASDVVDAEAVARIIFSMLPCVDQVGDPRRAWHQVNMHLETFISSAAVLRRSADVT